MRLPCFQDCSLFGSNLLVNPCKTLREFLRDCPFCRTQYARGQLPVYANTRINVTRAYAWHRLFTHGGVLYALGRRQWRITLRNNSYEVQIIKLLCMTLGSVNCLCVVVVCILELTSIAFLYPLRGGYNRCGLQLGKDNYVGAVFSTAACLYLHLIAHNLSMSNCFISSLIGLVVFP